MISLRKNSNLYWEMVIDENLKLTGLRDCMKFKNLSFIYSFIGFLTLLFVVMCFCILVDCKNHEVDVISKSPLLPFNKYDYMTTEDIIYQIDDKKQIIPEYFRTDFASIPQFFWFIEAPYKSNLVYASIWHDYYYSCPNGLSRKEIDDIFLSLLLNEGTGKISAMQMYLAVRLFGKEHFFNNGICDELIVHEMEQDEILYNQEVVDYE